MKLATLMLTHGNPELTADTVDAIEFWVGERVLVLVDQAGWPTFQNARIGSAKIEPGFFHKHNRNVYRNVALGLKRLYNYWPDCDWYVYTEYDCLFLSSGFKADLFSAEELNAWCLGVDLRRFNFQMPLLESLLSRGRIPYSYYLQGCCLFFSRKYLASLCETGFLDRLLESSKDFVKSTFPGYPRWSFEEELWPTAAVQFGGNLYELACWKGSDRQWQPRCPTDPRMIYAPGDNESWRGFGSLYPLRFFPEISAKDIGRHTCIAHPSKNLNDPVRIHLRNQRAALRKKPATAGQLYTPAPSSAAK